VTRDALRRWHRLASLVLVAQWSLWVVTALGMALVPRAWTTAYRAPSTRDVPAAEWPSASTLGSLLTAENTRRLAEGTPPVTHLRIHNPGGVVVASARAGEEAGSVHLDPRTGARLPHAQPGRILAEAGLMTGETLDAAAITLVTANSPEHQKLPVPVWRVEAKKAALFFDPVTGAFVSQATWWKWWENLLKTVHTLDPSGNAEFRNSIQLTVAAVLFLLAAFAGALSVRRFMSWRRGANTAEAWSFRWHQALGVVVVLQVLLQTTSGLAVVWLLNLPSVRGSAHLRDASEPLTAEGLLDPPCCGEAVTLTMLLGEPVYRIERPGRPGTQLLVSARGGEPRRLNNADRDELARRALIAPASLSRWELGTRIDERFFAGPFPAWKGTYSEPNPGTLAIDATTGRIHLSPRTGRSLFIEDYYKLHLASYDMDGVIRYRLEPTTLALIGLFASMLLTGLVLQVARLRRGRL
jgi:hypothetical protein